ncbi:TPA: winged helix-turn-helix transcriptional regulator [Legionella pneumophila]|nr:winged helix-turn-helix transcriptional regulator [Legionella pneumophila]HBD7283597.1 winged helix-turn-helix transcriptional regulator [Legionella pneumophila]HBD9439250.1 winged helix-turn-helix transcriptional regulator [Legionella pneumophila]HEN8241116.1 winged helix-turn-helix transcriptional regulator [Legionella pneumophila]|tara:strand:+ start:348 stop:647 length:300 start_codon:yes stop_codon:yes gene_type:complete
MKIVQMRENVTKAELLLKMLANQNRLLILCTLLKRPCSVSELNEAINLSQSALSQHLAKLRYLDLVSTEKIGQQVFYKIKSEEAKAVINTLYEIYCEEP